MHSVQMWARDRARQSEENLSFEKGGAIKPVSLMGKLRHSDRK